ADLLLTFCEQHDVHRQATVGLQMSLDRLHMEKELTLVVDRAARVDAPVADLRLECGTRPEVQRLGRLDIIVAIDQNGWRVGSGAAPLTDKNRMTRRLVELRLETGVLHLLHQPFGRLPRVTVVLAPRA